MSAQPLPEQPGQGPGPASRADAPAAAPTAGTHSVAVDAAATRSASEHHPHRQALLSAIESWRARLGAAGLACRAVALKAADATFQVELPTAQGGMASHWAALCARIHAGEPVATFRPETQLGGDLLMATALQLPDGQTGVIGLVLAPPHNDRMVQQVLLSLGWLQLSLAAARLERSHRAARLLELLAHVASQSGARAAAQEWVNRTAAWAREILSDAGATPTLTLFDVRHGMPHWWVAADAAWAEQASPAMQQAQEVATQALLEMQEVRTTQGWAAPVVSDGEVVAVLVARSEGDAAVAFSQPVLTVLRVSLGLAEPLLRRWQKADRSLLRHHLDALRSSWQKLRGPGHLVWKVGALGLVVTLLVLLVWPVPDRVNAHTVIEGRIRQIVTAPFDGFIGQVKVRPGQMVVRGQVLAKLDDRDLKLEQSKTRSERDQAAGKLRQAMAERDAPAMALALAEQQQAEAQLALVESKLSRAELVAPLDGLLITGDWMQRTGGPVEIGKEMFEIAAGDGYRVVLHVPDRDIARVHLAQTGVLRLTGQPQATHAFKINNLTATASVQDGVNGFRVEAEWLGSPPPLSPGMQGIGKVEVGQSNLLTVWTRSSIDWLRLKLWTWMW